MAPNTIDSLELSSDNGKLSKRGSWQTGNLIEISKVKKSLKKDYNIDRSATEISIMTKVNIILIFYQFFFLRQKERLPLNHTSTDFLAF
ncbi:MAG: hypothetical protein WCF03_15125 [Nitrososphaeraceae archaeon]